MRMKLESPLKPRALQKRELCIEKVQRIEMKNQVRDYMKKNECDNALIRLLQNVLEHQGGRAMGVLIRQNLKTGQALYTNEDAIEKSIKYNTRTGGSKEGMDDLIARLSSRPSKIPL